MDEWMDLGTDAHLQDLSHPGMEDSMSHSLIDGSSNHDFGQPDGDMAHLNLGQADANTAVNTIGEGDSHGVHAVQDTPFTCAVVSQEMILKEFGIEVSETQLAVEAAQNGWLTTDGTAMCDVGQLLQIHGVPCHQGRGMDEIVEELAQGHKVIVGVDGHELWNDGGTPDWLGSDPNHAVVIQGLKQHEDGSWTVVINDPGDPNGAGKEYPLDQFVDAAGDSGFFYAATDHAPPDLQHDPTFGAGFNVATGHYDGVMDWLDRHGEDLRNAAGVGVGVGLGALSMPLSSSSGAPVAGLSEKERNELLRRL